MVEILTISGGPKDLMRILIILIMVMNYYFSLLFINILKITLNLCLFFNLKKKDNWLFDKI